MTEQEDPRGLVARLRVWAGRAWDGWYLYSQPGVYTEEEALAVVGYLNSLPLPDGGLDAAWEAAESEVIRAGMRGPYFGPTPDGGFMASAVPLTYGDGEEREMDYDDMTRGHGSTPAETLRSLVAALATPKEEQVVPRTAVDDWNEGR